MQKRDWIISVVASDTDGVVALYRFRGTSEQMKDKIIQLSRQDRENDPEGYVRGCDCRDDIKGFNSDQELRANAVYKYYNIEYMAKDFSSIESVESCMIEDIVAKMEQACYRVDDSASLSTRDVIDIEDAVDIVRENACPDISQKIEEIKDILVYSQSDGAHHKAWALDQLAKILLGRGYDRFVKEYCEDGQYEWDCGIAP